MAGTTPASAPGERNLDSLLRTIIPTLSPTTHAYLNLPTSSPPTPSLEPHAIFTFREPNPPTHKEPHSTSTTLVVPLDIARNYVTDHADAAVWPCDMVTLDVQSSLEAVGFLAFLSAAWTREGIAANVVSGFWRDYVFVGEGVGRRVVEVLERVRTEAGG